MMDRPFNLSASAHGMVSFKVICSPSSGRSVDERRIIHLIVSAGKPFAKAYQLFRNQWYRPVRVRTWCVRFRHRLSHFPARSASRPNEDRWPFLAPFWWVALIIMLSGCGATPCSEIATFFGETGEMGEGAARTYVELTSNGHLVAIGVAFSEGMLEGLPAKINQAGRCFDVDGDGSFQAATECMGDYALNLFFPEELIQDLDTPFQWVGVDWNPNVRPAWSAAPNAWFTPHFDFHFYMVNGEAVEQIRAGPCGFFMDCEDFRRATTPLEPKYLPQDYIDVGAAILDMGNHLIDSTSPEIIDRSQKFTHTFIYGAYEGHITFFDPMVTHEFLTTRPNECQWLKMPNVWEVSGSYPTEYCIRYRVSEGEYTVSLEGFVYREAEIRYYAP